MLGPGVTSGNENHPRLYNAHAMGNHPSSLIVGGAQRPSQLYTTISLRWLPQGSHKQPREITPLRTYRIGRDCPECAAGPGRSAHPGAGLTAPSVSHCANTGNRRQVSPLLARWGRSVGLPGVYRRSHPSRAGKRSMCSVHVWRPSLMGAMQRKRWSHY